MDIESTDAEARAIREAAQRRERFDREGDDELATAARAISRAGLRGPLREVLEAALPALGEAGRMLLEARSPDSPGGVKVTKSEANAIGRKVATAIAKVEA